MNNLLDENTLYDSSEDRDIELGNNGEEINTSEPVKDEEPEENYVQKLTREFETIKKYFTIGLVTDEQFEGAMSLEYEQAQKCLDNAVTFERTWNKKFHMFQIGDSKC